MVIYNFLFTLLFALSSTAILNGMDVPQKKSSSPESSSPDGVRKLRSHESSLHRSKSQLQVPSGKRRSLSGTSRTNIALPSSLLLPPITETTPRESLLSAQPQIEKETDSAKKKRLSGLKRHQPSSSEKIDKPIETMTSPDTQQLPLLVISATPSPTIEASDVLKERSGSSGKLKGESTEVKDDIKKKRSSGTLSRLKNPFVTEKKSEPASDSIEKKSSFGKLGRSYERIKQRKSGSHEIISSTPKPEEPQKRLSWSAPLFSKTPHPLSPIDETHDAKTTALAVADIKPTVTLESVALTPAKPSLIDAVRRNDYILQKKLLSDKNFDPNAEKDASGNTAFLVALELYDRNSITLFLNNPCVDTLLRNKKGQMASEILAKIQERIAAHELPAYYELRTHIFSRNSLALQIKEYAKGQLIQKAHANEPLNKEKVIPIVQIIKAKLTKVDTQQTGDREMPRPAAELPPYATDDFIGMMFLAYLDREPKQPTSLQ